MSGWLVVVETTGEEIAPPDEVGAVARPLRDYYAAWFDKETDALKAMEKFAAGKTIKAERKMSDEELTLRGLTSVGEIKLLGTSVRSSF